MKKIILIGVIILLLTGCGSSKPGDIYENVTDTNKIINDKILNDKGCIGVEYYYTGNADSNKFNNQVTTCKEGIKEFKESIKKIDKKAKNLANSELKKEWKTLKDNYDSEMPVLEKSLELFIAWEKYTQCYNSKMITEKEVLKCLEPVFDLKYDEVEKILRGWVPLKVEESKIHNEYISYKYGNVERDELEPKLEEARKKLEDYEIKNEIHDHAGRLDFKPILTKMFASDSKYAEASKMFRYGFEKIKFSTFSSNIRSACLEEKDERCIND